MIFSPSSPISVVARFSSGVSIGPGATALQSTPKRAPSRAIVLVNAITPPLAAE